MCAAFTLKTNRQQILQTFGIPMNDEFAFDHRILPHSESLIVLMKESLQIHPMSFSMTPSWSKEAKVKFATHNARMETLMEKPTWRTPLKTKRCLVPLSEFIEPIYTGEYAGNMVRFAEASHSLLVAAGIYDIWVNKETGEIKESFAIITGEPPEFIERMGHDRCPVFLQKPAWESWLDPQQSDSAKAIKVLSEFRQNLQFTVSIDRALAKGWEKRVPKD